MNKFFFLLLFIGALPSTAKESKSLSFPVDFITIATQNNSLRMEAKENCKKDSQAQGLGSFKALQVRGLGNIVLPLVLTAAEDGKYAIDYLSYYGGVERAKIYKKEGKFYWEVPSKKKKGQGAQVPVTFKEVSSKKMLEGLPFKRIRAKKGFNKNKSLFCQMGDFLPNKLAPTYRIEAETDAPLKLPKRLNPQPPKGPRLPVEPTPPKIDR